ncbi:hemerythrin domain-containing protein [Glaciihabitans arcticus]|uniref:Hemerythrin domain-containing protein n=1 Tax=Glaciihabitans arcticus TaxID=2668039 RepID=A0A4Q9GQ45_9MICO|nr:hemerythrin domain-containing protein [Glaciihabitans arcticus]TBN56725.1 hemerythrin domain-containing protein [Glaciihabitans arcticus]
MNAERVVAWGSELRVVHGRLRDALAVAREAVEAGADTETLARDIRLFCWGFCVALDGHHSGEDMALFPALLAEHPELTDIVANLMRDHGMISHLISGLEATLNAGGNPQDLLRHLDGIEAVMETHFGYEERQIAGLLDGLLPGLTDPSTVLGPLAR